MQVWEGLCWSTQPALTHTPTGPDDQNRRESNLSVNSAWHDTGAQGEVRKVYMHARSTAYCARSRILYRLEAVVWCWEDEQTPNARPTRSTWSSLTGCTRGATPVQGLGMAGLGGERQPRVSEGSRGGLQCCDMELMAF